MLRVAGYELQPGPTGRAEELGSGLTYGYFELSEPLIILLLKQEGITNNVVDYVELLDWSRFRASGRCLQIAQNVCQRQRRFLV
jgi:hypothetical protein